MSDHPLLSETVCKVTVPSLATDAAVPVDLSALFDGKRVVGFEIHNTHATDALYWTGHGVTATVAAGVPVAAGVSSGFIPSNDKTISIIRTAGVAVTCRVMAIGR